MVCMYMRLCDTISRDYSQDFECRLVIDPSAFQQPDLRCSSSQYEYAHCILSSKIPQKALYGAHVLSSTCHPE